MAATPTPTETNETGKVLTAPDNSNVRTFVQKMVLNDRPAPKSEGENARCQHEGHQP